tara:strand:- start:169 stop:474 length:306 start_codon:yes stop_codon:yes gene_type:complete
MLFYGKRIDDTSKHLKKQQEDAILIYELKSSNKDMEEYLKFQGEVIFKQRQDLEKVDQVFRQQNDLINRLILKLKELDQWPPKENKENKDNRGGSLADFSI